MSEFNKLLKEFKMLYNLYKYAKRDVTYFPGPRPSPEYSTLHKTYYQARKDLIDWVEENAPALFEEIK